MVQYQYEAFPDTQQGAGQGAYQQNGWQQPAYDQYNGNGSVFPEPSGQFQQGGSWQQQPDSYGGMPSGHQQDYAFGQQPQNGFPQAGGGGWSSDQSYQNGGYGTSGSASGAGYGSNGSTGFPDASAAYGGGAGFPQPGYGGTAYDNGGGGGYPAPSSGFPDAYGSSYNAAPPPPSSFNSTPYGAATGGFPDPGNWQGQAPPQSFMPMASAGSYAGPPAYQGGEFQVHSQPVGTDGFQYSNCSGKKRALLIGINYVGTSNALRGCHNDVQNVKRFLVTKHNFREQDITVLMDAGGDRSRYPTKANIIRAMQALVQNAQPNDSLVFHFSGHGGSQKDTDGDEDDGFDETIYPLDHKESGMIVDDLMHQLLVKPLPKGARLLAIFDSCHSGSALDLPYIYSTKGEVKDASSNSGLATAGKTAMAAFSAYKRGNALGALMTVIDLGTKSSLGGKVNEATKLAKGSPADVVMLSGCKDDQTSADTQEAGQATGALSFSLISSLNKYPKQSYRQLLNTVRDELRAKRYTQKPQLSTGHPIDVDLIFLI